MLGERDMERDGADTDAIARGYEPLDVRSTAVYGLIGGVVLIIAVLCGGLWWLHGRLVNRRTPMDAPRSVVRVNPAVTNDAPPLQPQVGHESLDAWDLRKMHEREDKVFADLGWPIDVRTHRHAVPAAVLAKLRSGRPSTQPTTSTASIAPAAWGGVR